MTRWFNIRGPCIAADHYMLPAAERLPEVMSLIRKKRYFVVHAQRQCGKTTAFRALMDELNAKGEYVAMYCSVESAEVVTNPERGIPKIANLIRRSEGTLISFLRQLRNGRISCTRPDAFPVSIALIGMRNIRDYKMRVRPDGSYPHQQEIRMKVPENPWVRDDGLDMPGLMAAFQQFWRENADAHVVPYESTRRRTRSSSCRRFSSVSSTEVA